jgi:hypothetical protein
MTTTQVTNIKTLVVSYIPELAMNEAGYSNLPGKENGPYDAYRHLLWTAESTRVAGEMVSKTNSAIHEVQGLISGASINDSTMDFANNSVGYKIGRTSNSWEEVVQRCREVIELGAQNMQPDGSVKINAKGHLADGFNWMPEKKWSGNHNNPAPTNAQGQALPRSQWNWPSPKIPEKPYPNKKWSLPPNGNIDWNREGFLIKASNINETLEFQMSPIQQQNYAVFMDNLNNDIAHLPMHEQLEVRQEISNDFIAAAKNGQFNNQNEVVSEIINEPSTIPNISKQDLAEAQAQQRQIDEQQISMGLGGRSRTKTYES